MNKISDVEVYEKMEKTILNCARCGFEYDELTECAYGLYFIEIGDKIFHFCPKCEKKIITEWIHNNKEVN